MLFCAMMRLVLVHRCPEVPTAPNKIARAAMSRQHLGDDDGVVTAELQDVLPNRGHRFRDPRRHRSSHGEIMSPGSFSISSPTSRPEPMTELKMPEARDRPRLLRHVLTAIA
jgi:hypothetical protein